MAKKLELISLYERGMFTEPRPSVVAGPCSAETEEQVKALKEYADGLSGDAAAQSITYLYGDKSGELTISRPVKQLTVASLQDFIDGYIKAHSGCEVDYIHGIDSVKGLIKRENSIGFIFSGMAKSDLFPTVVFDGALPRKTFSMGHAEDKRYYMECRKIK